MGLQTLIQSALSLVNKTLLPLAVSTALLVFIWGLVRFLAKGGDTKATEEGRNIMVWGVLALFVMVSIWGILRFIQGNLNITKLTL